MALTGLEAASHRRQGGRRRPTDLARPDADAVQRKAIVYDRQGDAHYDVISAFIKSIRGSDPDAALFWLARMLEAGEDPRFIARRLIVHASEDIGLADPMALLQAIAAAHAVEHVGLPEARLNLAQATIYLARAPKSNSVYTALAAARRTRSAPSRCPIAPARRLLRRRASSSGTARATSIRTTSPATGSSRVPAGWLRAAATTSPRAWASDVSDGPPEPVPRRMHRPGESGTAHH